MNIRTTYTGFITKKSPGLIFVFGSNPEGRHGAGTALVAMNVFGAKYGVARGRTGDAYGIVTTDLRNKRRPNVPKNSIKAEIREMYSYALENPDLSFHVAYSGTSPRNLSGFTNEEIADMFIEAGLPPVNVVFERDFHRLVFRDCAANDDLLDKLLDSPESMMDASLKTHLVDCKSLKGEALANKLLYILDISVNGSLCADVVIKIFDMLWFEVGGLIEDNNANCPWRNNPVA